MIFNTSKTKNPSYNAILSVVFLVILTFGLFSGLFTKKALADNNYIDNIQFYRDADGYYRMKFHVKTSWDVSLGQLNDNGNYYCYFNSAPYIGIIGTFNMGFMIFPGKDNTPYIDPSVCGSTIHYVAGNTYDTYVFIAGATFIAFNHNGLMCNKTGNCAVYDFSFDNYFGRPATPDDYITNIGFDGYFPYVDTEKYYFTAYPNLTITYPNNNNEIAGAFYVDGSYLVPSLDKYSRLLFWLTTPDNNTYPNAYYDLPATSGNFHVLISNIPAGYYYLNFVFTGNYTYYYPDKIYIHIVNDIPEILSTGETTPSTPAFGYTSPDTYYVAHSNYSTSTALFNELSNSIGALIQSVGNSLSAFAGKFSLTDAQKTATMMAGSISTIRTYGDNLNSFFDSLPVSEILLLYLIIFVAVIVFRLIKNLVNLIKP